ncbi:MAG: hypothetical protein GX465_04095 [Acidobacteria bacterium]|nr:hypothetical protein [Acidobacteriota bacterium]
MSRIDVSRNAFASVAAEAKIALKDLAAMKSVHQKEVGWQLMRFIKKS